MLSGIVVGCDIAIFLVLEHLLFFFLKSIYCILEGFSLLDQLLHPRTDFFGHVVDRVFSVRNIVASDPMAAIGQRKYLIS